MEHVLKNFIFVLKPKINQRWGIIPNQPGLTTNRASQNSQFLVCYYYVWYLTFILGNSLPQ